jgi:hypothetical protein
MVRERRSEGWAFLEYTTATNLASVAYLYEVLPAPDGRTAVAGGITERLGGRSWSLASSE